MNYIGQDELTEMMGIGYMGEVRRGPDGALYQWVEGVDGLGNVSGFWSRIKRGIKTVTKFARKPWCIPLQAIPRPIKGIAKRVCRVVGKLSPLAHVPVVGSYYKGAAKLCKIAKDCGIAGLEQGLMDGTLAMYYQGISDDGNLYGLAEDEVLYGLGQEDLTEIMGIGRLGEVRQSPDGDLYQWVEGIDGLGRRKRFWHCRRCLAIKKRLARLKRRKRLPSRQPAASRSSSLPQPQPSGVKGLGNLYQAPDGSMYEMTGLGEDEDLYGLAEDEELYGLSDDDELYGFAENEDLYGLAEDEDLYGLAEDEELYGLAQDEDLYGLAEDEDLYGLAEDEDLYGIGEDEDLYGLAEDEDLDGVNGYIKEGMNGLEAYVPDKPPGTRMFVKPAQTPDVWKPLW